MYPVVEQMLKLGGGSQKKWLLVQEVLENVNISLLFVILIESPEKSIFNGKVSDFNIVVFNFQTIQGDF
jgi:hypothetical protein